MLHGEKMAYIAYAFKLHVIQIWGGGGGAVFFSKVHPVCHNIANGFKPGSDSKKTDKHAADCSNTVC